MSTTSRVRKSSPVKQGPMRATIPMSSLLRQNNTSNTNWRRSPDNINSFCSTSTNTNINTNTNTNTCSGQRSPGSVSLAYKAKSKSECKGPGNIIRRTASLDTIYLKGQWPRDTFYFHCGLLQVDKATQTEAPSSSPSPSSSSSCLNECYHRQQQQQQQRQRSSKERDRIYNICSETISTTTTTTTTTTTKACPVNIPIIKPMIKPPMRNSIEGLNQEIERLVLKGTSPKGTIQLRSTSNNSMEKEDFEFDLQLNLNLEQMTPEGHRAPLADLLRLTRSVNTQTPAGTFEKQTSTSVSASASDSSSPDDDQLYYSSTRFFSTSPHINRFLAREPPDGCERVNLRFYDDTCSSTVTDTGIGTGIGTGTLLNPPNVTFQLKPSLGSAFQPLKIHHNTNDASTTSNNSNNAQSPG